MKIGAMNHPAEPIEKEITWMADLELDFIDLTLEPPAAATWRIDVDHVKKLLRDRGLGVVGHTAYYLPIASSFESLRRAAVDELKRAADKFVEVGAKWMNLHPDGHAPFTDESAIVQRNIDSLGEITAYGKSIGLGVMLENVPGRFNSVKQLDPIFRAVPDAGLHLDIGHANLDVPHNTCGELVEHFAKRIAHVHLHDNRGGYADLHLALGMGNLNVPLHLRELRSAGYDATITLEVFSRDPHFLGYSRDRLRAWWNVAA